jgi:hypothetical protein
MEAFVGFGKKKKPRQVVLTGRGLNFGAASSAELFDQGIDPGNLLIAEFDFPLELCKSDGDVREMDPGYILYALKEFQHQIDLACPHDPTHGFVA